MTEAATGVTRRRNDSTMRRGMVLLTAIAVLSTALLILAPNARAANVPKFSDYPARTYSGKRAPLQLTKNDRTFRTRLTQAYENDAINFGGKYVLTFWGCGTECVMGAAIDTTTGRVAWIPFTLCCFSSIADADENFEPIVTRVDSRLAVFTGQRDERGPVSTWFYELKSGRWILRGSVPRATT